MAVQSLTSLQIQTIDLIAKSTRSDPFLRNRVISHHTNGVQSIDDYAAEYLVGEKAIKKP